jgi:hypothetical protein
MGLIKKLALLRRVEPLPDPEGWYRNIFGVEPDYSDILEMLSTMSPSLVFRRLKVEFPV